MAEKYNHRAIENKWQQRWAKEKSWETKDDDQAPNFYVLDMFPYPSAEGLHVGHPEGYTASDIMSRYLRMKGYQVLHPMGFDSFGLPAENYAIKTGTHPAESTAKNIENMRRQIKSLGFSYDWSREVVTSDPAYYKWTQWIFLQLFKKGLAYESYAPINWCPQDKTGLANEEVIDGKCERCGTTVIKKNIKQWLIKITDEKYIERLLNDLDDLDWPDSVKQAQRNWIGRSEGTEIDFKIDGHQDKVSVFTTRADTLFGATYMVLAPEHPLVKKIISDDKHEEVQKYQELASAKSDLERTDLAKEKTGVFIGAYAINPANEKKIPIWVADYVLLTHGTGAIMAVPAHDERDQEFATRYKLPLVPVIQPPRVMPKTYPPIGSAAAWGVQDTDIETDCWTGDGTMINSGQFNDASSEDARKEITALLVKQGKGRASINYKLRDWLFSRQRYWGEPIPIIHCQKCGLVPVPEDELPVELPDIKKYEPTGTGESPLATIDDWVNTKCPKCDGKAKRETNTMPQWAGSNWYFLRYCDPHNDKQLADPEKLKKWMPVNLYIGGAEHTVLHLLYARFIYKFLFDIGAVPKEVGDEPFATLKNQGLIMGEDGVKMSKSRGNVINPDDVIKEYGADVLRMYEMFMGPFEDSKPWDTKGIIGIKRFLDRVWFFVNEMVTRDPNNLSATQPDEEIVIEKAIKKVGEDIELFRFNTAISELMKLMNVWMKGEYGVSSWNGVEQKYIEKLLVILSPFAPHICEELWERLGHKKIIAYEQWPSYDEKLVVDEKVTIVVQVNGKLRDNITLLREANEKEVKELALASSKVKKYITSQPKKVIFVKGRLINFVV
ncbi:leucine--tRNA ligase [Patescibacteria group bacterium]|nr:leucine--tRNA ligase [Patescibacteria group bacterium]